MRLFNGLDANDYCATLWVDGKRLSARIDSSESMSSESALDSEILQGLGRADHMDWMIQKTTELGVKRISLFPAERSQSPIKAAQLDKKLLHWRSVAISACEQSGRALLPTISYHPNLDEALTARRHEQRLLLDFAGPPLQSCLQASATSVAILLGPEGGLTTSEIERAKSAGFMPASLGPRVLRTETAATSALAIAQSLLGDMG